MSFDKILFAFVIVLALTLNVGFVVGDIDWSAPSARTFLERLIKG